MKTESARPVPGPFGKRNRRTEKKPARAKLHKRHEPKRPAVPQATKNLYLYLAGGILFVALAGYALAA